MLTANAIGGKKLHANEDFNVWLNNFKKTAINYGVSKKTVNELYLEILHRDADREGLTHFSALLENRKMTIDDLRKKLLDSDEYRILQSS